jgi:hypothetical protein
MLKFPRAIIFFLLTLALCSGVSANGGGGVGPSEPQMKAAFLLNFPKYVEWPADSLPGPDSPMVFAVFGDEDVANELATMISVKSIEGHPIQLVRDPSLEKCLECQVLFIGSDEARKAPEIVKQLKCASILTVGENEQFMNEGGMINLARRDRHIVIEVNLEATRQTELKISSKLMALATVKGGKR